ncbi:MAG TPA: DUF1365 domain-containing protein [Turneriella sp.]|nr:DUF1365 domain-containing protein [Turneriella sp.]
MQEGIYEIDIKHTRTTPKTMKFRVRGYCFFIDVARFDSTDNFPGYLHRFNRSDYSLLSDNSLSAELAAKKHLENSAKISADKVFLLANPRILGYVFNSVSLFYYYKSGVHVATIVEVNNTFGEQKHYTLIGESQRSATKNFYVSPFISSFDQFNMHIEAPNEKLTVKITTSNYKEVLLVASMTGLRHKLTPKNIIYFLFKYPWHTARIIILIHWYALRLFFARVPFYGKKVSEAALLYKKVRR